MNPFDGLKLAVGGFLGGLIVYGWATFLYGPSQYSAGQTAEREAAIQRANDLIARMENDNAAISDMDHRAKCAEFGFKWLPDLGCH